MTGAAPPSLLRQHSDVQRATNIELFFDLVFVFAITQLSHHLVAQPTVQGTADTLLLLAMVWVLWAYTMWVTNWVDPQRLSVRLLLIGLMLASLVMSAGLPEAFTDRAMWVGAAYAAMQIGRTVFVIVALRGHPLGLNFQRILAWCVISSTFAIVGATVEGHGRELLWLLAVAVDLTGGVAGFYTPGLGRSRTSEWTIEGNHMAERCQAFVLIAVGESIVVTGGTFAALHEVTAGQMTAFVVAFLGDVALWWVYFDRSADEAAEVVAASPDPGRLGRDAYHLIHPIMVAGIIVTAAADERVLAHPSAVGETATTWAVLGGTALFLLGHALFKYTVWRVVPWPRLAAVVVLAVLGLLAPHVSALALGCCAAVVVVAVAVIDRALHPRTGRP